MARGLLAVLYLQTSDGATESVISQTVSCLSLGVRLLENLSEKLSAAKRSLDIIRVFAKNLHLDLSQRDRDILSGIGPPSIHIPLQDEGQCV